MKKQALLVLGIFLLLPASLGAQSSASAGARVRMATKNDRTSYGLLLAVSSDSVLIGFSDSAITPQARARSEIISLQKSLGGNGLRAAAIGAQLGALTGAIGFGVEHLMSRSSDPRFHYDNGDLGFAAGKGAVYGFVVGAVTGAIIAQERWEEAALPSSSEPLPSPGARAALQMRARLGLFGTGRAIRLRTQEGQQVQGTFDGLTSDFVRIVSDSSYLVPIVNIREISERRPKTGSWLTRGMWLGAALGVGFVATVALNEEGCDSDPGGCISAWGYAPAFGIYGALTGAAVGAILGSHVKGWRTQKW